MGEATRGLLHWFSALIALPAVVYAGRPFFASAWAALRHGRTNMDVPISIGIVLACAMSLFETVRGGEHAYFDSAVMLLFFLLVGRYLDRRARGRARGAAERLLALGVGAVTVLDADGRQRALPAAQVAAGAAVLVAAGERIGIDGRVTGGVSEIDAALITGETTPQPVGPGDPVFAGALNLGAPLKLEVTATGEDTLLAEIVRLMEAAEQRRARYVVLADRVARLYAPAVHSLAFATFLGWVLIIGAPWQLALLYAVAVLIITCPCALGLAVPAVQVIASGRLLRGGILLKSATALERLAQVDTVVFDKTGTLTLGRPTLDYGGPVDAAALTLAASIAAASRHPLARALVAAAPDVATVDGVVEVPGAGLRWQGPDGEVRLGNRVFCSIAETEDASGPELWLARPGRMPVRFAFRDELRGDALAVVAELRARGLAVELLSGDRAPIVANVARALKIDRWRAACTPADKTARLEALAAAGWRVLMVGDGLNDAPALAAARVSLSPASALDISQNAADAVFQGDRLRPVAEVLEVARRADRLIRQNLGLALA
jgi:Cu2+-exporting ATPase